MTVYGLGNTNNTLLALVSSKGQGSSQVIKFCVRSRHRHTHYNIMQYLKLLKKIK